ncbi:MAG: hypothetical protein ACMUHY_04670 [Thermoplasmatota archaeon]
METRGLDVPPRSSAPSIKFENGTFIIDGKTGSKEYGTLWIGMNADIRVIGATLKVDGIVSLSNGSGSRLIMRGFNGTPAILSIVEGYADIMVESIHLQDSRIVASHSAQMMETGEDGKNTQIHLRAAGGGIVMIDTSMEAYATGGAAGNAFTYPGYGGDAEIVIEDIQGGGIEIIESVIIAEGGDGGSATTYGAISGCGGSASLWVNGDSVSISGSDLREAGGRAGSITGNSEGNDGGSASTVLRSNQDINLHHTDVISLGGMSTRSIPEPAPSFLRCVSTTGSLLWDDNKEERYSLSSMSMIETLSFQVQTEGDSHLHQVNLNNIPPTPLGHARINLHWWFEVVVIDTYGCPIKGATLFHIKGDDPDILPGTGAAPVTDEQGLARLELITRIDDKVIDYTFVISLVDGNIPQTTPKYRNPDDGNIMVRAEVDIVTMEVLIDMEDPKGDIWNITGTTTKIVKSPITNMSLFIDGQWMANALDLSPKYETDYSRWSFELNVSSVSPGMHILKIVLICGEHETNLKWSVDFAYEIYNHPPNLDRITLFDLNGRFVIDTGKVYPVRVSTYKPSFILEVGIEELDWSSAILGDGQGRNIESLIIEITPQGRAGLMFSEEVPDPYLNHLVQGTVQQTVIVDTTRRNDKYDPWEKGRYILTIEAFDDAGIGSGEFQTVIDLHIDQAPLLIIRAGEDGSIVPIDHPLSTQKFFRFETPQDRDLSVWFDLTGCKDLDDPSYFPHPAMDRSWKNLTCTVSLSLNGSEPWVIFGPEKGASGFFHTFDLSNFSKDDLAVFEMILDVEDTDGVETELKVLIEVQLGPPVHREAKLPIWILLLIMAVWISAMVLSFAFILPVYTRHRSDKIRKLLKDPKLYGVTIQAMKGEKPTDHFVSEREIRKGLMDKLETGSLDAGRYESIMGEWKTAQEKVSIISGEPK